MSGASRSGLVLGAVAYDPKVVTIWEGFGEWFGRAGIEVDYLLFSNYERLVDAHLAGVVHLAWNSPLAWLRTRLAAEAQGREATTVVMRDTDQDLTSVVLVRSDDSAEQVGDLYGRTVGTGALDSPQATLVPLGHLAAEGLDPMADISVRRFDVLVGKHGDHVGGERDAVTALLAGEVDAACIADSSHLLFARDGSLPIGATRVLSRTAPYDHCVLTALDDVEPEVLDAVSEVLLAMSFGDPEARRLLELEGLTEWRRGRDTAFDALEAAVHRFGVYHPDGNLGAGWWGTDRA